MKNFRNIIFNSAILLVCAALLQMTLHELAHFIAAILIHAKNVTLYHNYVSADTTAVPQYGAILYAAAGPFASLLIGGCFHLVCLRQQKRNLLFLFNAYMAAFGYIAFFGYLIVAPFFTYGDTGYIFDALGFPMWLTAGIAITGAVTLYLLMRKLIRFFAEMGTSDIIADKKLRRRFMGCLVHYPLYIGIVVTTLLNLPTPSVLSLVYPICSPFSLMWAYGTGITKPYPTDNMNTDISCIDHIQPVWLIILLLIVVINRLLVCGIVAN